MTGEPGVPQSMGSQIVRRDLATEQQQQHCTPQLGKGEDSGVSRSCCVPEARTCSGCGQCRGRGSGSSGPGVPPSDCRPAWPWRDGEEGVTATVLLINGFHCDIHQADTL